MANDAKSADGGALHSLGLSSRGVLPDLIGTTHRKIWIRGSLATVQNNLPENESLPLALSPFGVAFARGRIPRHRVRGHAMTSRIGLVAALLSAFLGGCASVGNQSIADASAESVSGQIIKGRTTQAQVREFYGDPMKTSFTDSGNESWEYEFSRLRSKPTNFVPYVNAIYSGAEGDKKSLVIFFDKRKIVQQYTISTSQVDISQGLFVH